MHPKRKVVRDLKLNRQDLDAFLEPGEAESFAGAVAATYLGAGFLATVIGAVLGLSLQGVAVTVAALVLVVSPVGIIEFIAGLALGEHLNADARGGVRRHAVASAARWLLPFLCALGVMFGVLAGERGAWVVTLGIGAVVVGVPLAVVRDQKSGLRGQSRQHPPNWIDPRPRR